jgi:hypothetical protein
VIGTHGGMLVCAGCVSNVEAYVDDGCPESTKQIEWSDIMRERAIAA